MKVHTELRTAVRGHVPQVVSPEACALSRPHCRRVLQERDTPLPVFLFSDSNGGNSILFQEFTNHLRQECANPRCLGSRQLNYVQRHLILVQLLPFFLYIQKASISPHAPSRNHQIKVKFTGHSSIVGHQYGNYFLSPFRHLQFGGRSQIFVKFVYT